MRRILSMVMQAPTIAVLLLSIAGYLSWLLVLSRQHFLIPSRNSCLISFFSRSLPPPPPPINVLLSTAERLPHCARDWLPPLAPRRPRVRGTCVKNDSWHLKTIRAMCVWRGRILSSSAQPDRSIKSSDCARTHYRLLYWHFFFLMYISPLLCPCPPPPLFNGQVRINLPRAYSNKYVIWTGFLLLPYGLTQLLEPTNALAPMLAPAAPVLNFFADGAYAY